MHLTLRGLLVNGALIASLFVALVVGDKLGGKWELLFPAYIVALLVALLLYRRRRGWPAGTRQGSFSNRGRVLLVLVAVALGLLFGGPTLAFIGSLGAALGLLIVLGIRRTF